MTEKLKPCPFCGGEDLIFFHHKKDGSRYYKDAIKDFGDNSDFYQNYSYPVNISCMKCGVFMYTEKDIPEAIEAWNRRATNESSN